MVAKQHYTAWYDPFVYGETLKLLEGFHPYATPVCFHFDCGGYRSVFDDALRYSPDGNQPQPQFAVKNLGNYSVHSATSEFIQAFRIGKILRNITIPLNRVDALDASKSKLSEYENLYAFGKHNYDLWRHEKPELSEREYFDYCIKGGLGEGGNDFTLAGWAPSLKWNNSGGSHRFSTAYYIAKRDSIDFPITGNIYLYQLNYDWFDELSRYFDLYLFGLSDDTNSVSLYDLFDINTHSQHHTFIQLTGGDHLNLIYDHQHGRQNTILLLINKSFPVNRLLRRFLSWAVSVGYMHDFRNSIHNIRCMEQRYIQLINNNNILLG